MQVVTSAAETLLEGSARRKYDAGLASWRRAQEPKEPRARKQGKSTRERSCEQSPSGYGANGGLEILIGCVDYHITARFFPIFQYSLAKKPKRVQTNDTP